MARLLQRGAALNRVRLRNHSVRLVLGEQDHNETLINIPVGLVLGAITNLIDNSVYWLNAKWPLASEPDSPKAIFMGIESKFIRYGAGSDCGRQRPFRDGLGDLLEPSPRTASESACTT